MVKRAHYNIAQLLRPGRTSAWRFTLLNAGRIQLNAVTGQYSYTTGQYTDVTEQLKAQT